MYIYEIKVSAAHVTLFFCVGKQYTDNKPIVALKKLVFLAN